MNCQSCKDNLPNLLLDPLDASNAAAQAHLESCTACSAEFRELTATFDLLDAWVAPEPSPYFDQKLAVRLREEQAAPPAGWFERLRIRLQLNTGRQFRPALAGALALALVVVGGTAIDLSTTSHTVAHVQPSATINDLQILDRNDQAMQTMDQLLDDSGSSDSAPTNPAS
jgi:anti-sigma factor RsiW